MIKNWSFVNSLNSKNPLNPLNSFTDSEASDDPSMTNNNNQQMNTKSSNSTALTLENIKNLLLQTETNLHQEISTITALVSNVEPRLKAAENNIQHDKSLLYQNFVESSSKKFSIRLKDTGDSKSIDEIVQLLSLRSGIDSKNISIREIAKKNKKGQRMFAAETIFSEDRFKIFKWRVKLNKESKVLIDFPTSKIWDEAKEALEKNNAGKRFSTNFSGFLIGGADFVKIDDPFSFTF